MVSFRHRWSFWVVAIAAMSCKDDPPSEMKVTVQALDRTHGCYVDLPGGGPVDPRVPLKDGCDAVTGAGNVDASVGGAAGTAPFGALKGGLDQLRLIVSYGDLRFDNSNPAPLPTVTMSLDGVPTTPNANIYRIRTSEPAAFGAAFTVPSHAVEVMQLQVSAATGYALGPIGPYRVDDPEVVATIAECPEAMISCHRVSGVETATIEVSAPGTGTSTTGTITSTLNGVVQSASTSVTLTPKPGSIGVIHGVAAVQAPAAADGAQWLLAAQVGTSVGQTRVVTLDPPKVRVTIDECPAADGGSCSLTGGGTPATVQVTTNGMVATTGTITSTLGGVVQSGSTNVSLTPQAGSIGSIHGVATVPIPTTAPEGRSWTLTAQVGTAVGQTSTVTLHAPQVVATVDQCPATGPCSVVAGVGQVSVTVTAPGVTATTGSVISILDGSPQSAVAQSVTLSPAGLGKSGLAGVVFVDVPSAAANAKWALSVQVGSLSSTAQIMTLTEPEIVASLAGCASGPCTVVASKPTGLKISVPLRMLIQQATVTTMVDNVPGAGAIVVNLNARDIPSNTLSGVVSLTAPARAGADWIINVNVGEYNAPSIIATTMRAAATDGGD